MDHFRYHEGELWCDELRASEVAERAGTPCYVYSRATLVDHYDRLAAAFADLSPLICYSIKSCGNLAVCRTLAERGAGMDLVSGGELHRARLAGVDPARCVYAGVGKTDREIREALDAGIGWFNVESEAEFENISAIASVHGARCRAALRVNPDVDPRTHRYTTTGKKETKFGVDLERAEAFFDRYGDDPACRLCGIHLHIGSPVYRVEAYVESVTRALGLVDRIERVRGRRVVEMLDLGGGFGADYETEQSPVASDYADRIVPLLADRARDGLQVVLEPGRTISANAGILLVRVLYVKRSGDKTFVICDGGMNTLMRPCHYDAFHFIWPAAVSGEHEPTRRAREMDLPGLVPVDVVGPICETGDFFAIDRALPPVKRGDLLAVFATGAYGMSMANHYNSQPLPTEVMVDGDRLTRIRRAETYDDLTGPERNPEVLVEGGTKAHGHEGTKGRSESSVSS
ncbi:MAG: diaminopimelate decarboxylase [Planctomycetes bacterium]|nr:diaminopimelate decarboxylase [Planctomycetota bacterium]